MCVFLSFKMTELSEISPTLHCSRDLNTHKHTLYKVWDTLVHCALLYLCSDSDWQCQKTTAQCVTVVHTHTHTHQLDALDKVSSEKEEFDILNYLINNDLFSRFTVECGARWSSALSAVKRMKFSSRKSLFMWVTAPNVTTLLSVPSPKKNHHA